MGYKKKYYSGVCLCGHVWHTHHTSMCNLDYYNQTGESSIAGECLRYGCNEGYTGDDDEGDYHCSGFTDKENPDLEELKSWHGTRR
jgi:hypothetical protein